MLPFRFFVQAVRPQSPGPVVRFSADYVDIILCFLTQRFGHIALRVEVYGQDAEAVLGIVRGEVDGRRRFRRAAFPVDD